MDKIILAITLLVTSLTVQALTVNEAITMYSSKNQQLIVSSYFRGASQAIIGVTKKCRILEGTKNSITTTFESVEVQLHFIKKAKLSAQQTMGYTEEDFNHIEYGRLLSVQLPSFCTYFDKESIIK